MNARKVVCNELATRRIEQLRKEATTQKMPNAKMPNAKMPNPKMPNAKMAVAYRASPMKDFHFGTRCNEVS